ncbi:MAG: N-acetyltransferase family protein [Victivallales bacterium]
MEIRVATENDAAGALAVYAQHINTSVTFEYELPSIDEFSRRISDTLKTHPYLVCMESGKLCGYAYAHQLKEREAYQWSAELSIYLDSGITSRGMGRTLYALLIEILKHQGVRTVYGCVTIPNPRSEKLHESRDSARSACSAMRDSKIRNGMTRHGLKSRLPAAMSPRQT